MFDLIYQGETKLNLKPGRKNAKTGEIIVQEGINHDKERMKILKSIRKVAASRDDKAIKYLLGKYTPLFKFYAKKYPFLNSNSDLIGECHVGLLKACRGYRITSRVPFFFFLRRVLSNHFSHLLKAYYRPCRNLSKALVSRLVKKNPELSEEEAKDMVLGDVVSYSSFSGDDLLANNALNSERNNVDPLTESIFSENIEKIERDLTLDGIKVFREFVSPNDKTRFVVEGRVRNKNSNRVLISDISESLNMEYSTVHEIVNREIKPVISDVLGVKI